MRKLFVLFFAPALILLGMSVPAAAQTAQDCRQGTYEIKNRPDSGIGGTWALDTFTRTVDICRVAGDLDKSVVEVESWDYEIVGQDSGTFKTQGSKTPGGVEVDEDKFAGRTGQFKGEWSLKFTAPANWSGYIGDSDKPNRNDLSTSAWIAALWQGNPNGFNPGKFSDWSWTYTLCKDVWVNSADGNEGDINEDSGCPEPTPTATVTASPSPSASPTASVGTTVTPTAGTGGVAGGDPELPVTGFKAGTLAGGAALVILVGLGLLVAARRRRDQFETS